MRKALLHLKKSDPILRQIIERVGPCRIEYRDPAFSTLARAIVFQQLAGAAATRIFDRFQALVDPPPLTAEAVLRLHLRRLRGAGLSLQKATYLRDLSKKTVSGAIPFQRLSDLPDQEVIDALTQVKGVGVWTAHMFLIFALRRPDVLPTGDYGIRAAMKKAYDLPDLPKPAEMERLAQPWRPYASVASWYLWQSLRKATAPPTTPAG